MTAGRLHHVLLQATDLAATEAFFVDFVGFDVRHRDPFPDGRPLTVTEQGLGLTDGGPGTTNALDHVAFEWHDIADLAERARAEGVTILKEPGPGPYGFTVYLADPDGNKIEFFEDGPGTPS